MSAKIHGHGKQTTPRRPALCDKLAGDKNAGTLLEAIMYWHPFSRIEGGWVVNDHKWWGREAQLTPRQLERALTLLDKELGLIERCQRPSKFHRYKAVLHVRPTQIVLDYIAKATSWEAAEAFIPSAQKGKKTTPESAEYGTPSPANTANPTSAEYGEPCPAKTADSIEHKNLHQQQHKQLACGSPSASAQEAAGTHTETSVSGEIGQGEKVIPSPVDVVNAWRTGMSSHYAKAIAAGLVKADPDPEGIGHLANLITALACMWGPNGNADMREHAIPIINAAIAKWPAFAKQAAANEGLKHPPALPRPGFLLDHFSVLLNLMKLGKTS